MTDKTTMADKIRFCYSHDIKLETLEDMGASPIWLAASKVAEMHRLAESNEAHPNRDEGAPTMPVIHDSFKVSPGRPYTIRVFEPGYRYGISYDIDDEYQVTHKLTFRGPGRDGVTEVGILWIVIDRLEYLQTTDSACEENAQAIVCLCKAIGCLMSQHVARDCEPVPLMQPGDIIS